MAKTPREKENEYQEALKVAQIASGSNIFDGYELKDLEERFRSLRVYRKVCVKFKNLPSYDNI